LFDLFKKGFLANLRDYEGFGVDFPIGILVAVLFAVMIAVTAVVSYRKYLTVMLASRLLRKEAISEDSAKTLSALGIQNFGISFVLSSGGETKKLFKIKGKREYTYEEYKELISTKGYKEEKTDLKTAELYINPDDLVTAKRIGESEPPGLLSTVLFCLLIVIAYFAITMFLPDILNYISNLSLN